MSGINCYSNNDGFALKPHNKSFFKRFSAGLDKYNHSAYCVKILYKNRSFKSLLKYN